MTLGPIDERQRVVLDAVGSYSDLRVETAADEDTLEGGRRAAGPMLAANPAITAMICANDLMALGALRELRDSGLRVPQDISVTGFDNIKLAQFSYPPLTSVHSPARTSNQSSAIVFSVRHCGSTPGGHRSRTGLTRFHGAGHRIGLLNCEFRIRPPKQ